MPSFKFTMLLKGVSELSEDLAAKLFAAGLDDGLLFQRNGAIYVDVEREAESAADAILSAIADVEGSGTELRVSRVGPDDIVTASELSRRLNRTRENIRQLINGDRGPGGFPPPLSLLGKNSAIWLLSDVAEWWVKHGFGGAECFDSAKFIAALNGVLTVRQFPAESCQILPRLRLGDVSVDQGSSGVCAEGAEHSLLRTSGHFWCRSAELGGGGVPV